jgi:hypothetical protein
VKDEKTPRVAILGAGPIGLEAALYARYLGYEVRLFEQKEVAHHVLCWGNTAMFTPFRANCSPLGIAALDAHGRDRELPASDTILTARAWAEEYLIPLSETDLVADTIHVGHQVLAVGRKTSRKLDDSEPTSRAGEPFRLVARHTGGRESLFKADIVIDATGVAGNPNHLGRGGLPILGEAQARQHFEYGIHDFSPERCSDFADQDILVVGCDVGAALTVVALNKLALQDPTIRVNWIAPDASDPYEPVARVSQDPIAKRDELARQANRIAADPDSAVTYLADTSIESAYWDDTRQRFDVGLHGHHAGEHQYHRIMAHVGYHPDRSLYRELRVRECHKDESAVAELGGVTAGPDTLRLTEPNFFILGAKSRGRAGGFQFADGISQIRDAFTIIGGRADLDLYATFEQYRL